MLCLVFYGAVSETVGISILVALWMSYNLVDNINKVIMNNGTDDENARIFQPVLPMGTTFN